MIRWLERLDATLKVVIAGNHDWALSTDSNEFRRGKGLDRRIFGNHSCRPTAHRYDVLAGLFTKNIFFMQEESRTFFLENGAKMEVYSSPYTPYRPRSAPGFRFRREDGRK